MGRVKQVVAAAGARRERGREAKEGDSTSHSQGRDGGRTDGGRRAGGRPTLRGRRSFKLRRQQQLLKQQLVTHSLSTARTEVR